MDKKEMLKLRLSGLTYQAIADKAEISRQRVQQLLSPPKVIRDIVVAKYDGKCVMCGLEVGISGHVHHKEENGEANYQDIDNLLLLCASCHMLQHVEPSNNDTLAKRFTKRAVNKDIDIRHLRKVLMLDVGELAKIMGVNVGTIYRWTTGDQRPRVGHQRKMLKLLQKGVYYL